MSILNKVTLQNLKKNRTRTLVTIIGIVLSVAMFTAVTTSVSSMQNYVMEVTIDQEGTWQGKVSDLNQKQTEKIFADDKVEKATMLQTVGYASVDVKNGDKPYLYIMGLDGKQGDLLAIHMLSGHMPETENEILLPEHLKKNGGLDYEIGDTLTLGVGERQLNGYRMGQNNLYLEGEEELVVEKTITYTVVGFYERPSFEDYSAPGYTALTMAGNNGKDLYDAYVALEDMGDIYNWLDTEFKDYKGEVHTELLRYSGKSDEDSLNGVLYSMAGVLIGIIMFGSVSLIYNAFSISVNERIKQFGLLKSIGATKKQIMHSVLFEAFTLCAIGIPLGLLAGIGGIAVTFRFTGGLFDRILNDVGVSLHLSVSGAAVAIAVAVGIITVLISAWLPARKAVRISAIASVRQNNDIKITGKKVKTSKLTLKLFGFEGMLASKNYKRNKRRYRATVMSLFMSIVLFVSADSFCTYMLESVDTIDEGQDYDLGLYVYEEDTNETADLGSLKERLAQCQGVTKIAYTLESDMLDDFTVNLAQESINPEYQKFENSRLDGETAQVYVGITFIDDETYKEFLEEQKLDPAVYMNPKTPVAVAMDFVQKWDDSEQKYVNFRGLKETPAKARIRYPKQEIDGYKYDTWDFQELDGVESTVYVYKNAAGEQKKYSEAEAENTTELQIGTTIERGPFFMGIGYGRVELLYPYSMREQILGSYATENTNALQGGYFYVQSDSPAATEQEMRELLAGLGIGNSIHNRAENMESERALVTVVTVFAYGFIVLISLIALANVFNTISTNIQLRRREFAMLRSVGMTRKGFRKMMDFECILYGVKGLLYGVPTALAVTWLIYKSINEGIMMPYLFPWKSILISAVSVFAVVFATMLYGMHKLNRENTIDALKNENL